METHRKVLQVFAVIMVTSPRAVFLLSANTNKTDTGRIAMAAHVYHGTEFTQEGQQRVFSWAGNGSIRTDQHCSLLPSFSHFTNTDRELTISLLAAAGQMPQDMSGTCKVYITSPQSTVMWFLFVNRSCSGGVFITFSDDLSHKKWDVCTFWYLPFLDFTTSSNMANLSIDVRDISAIQNVTIIVRAEPQHNLTELEKHYLSSRQGFVQSPHWRHVLEQGPGYPPNLDSWARIYVPSGHLVMATVLYSDLDVTYFLAHKNDWLEVSALQPHINGITSPRQTANPNATDYTPLDAGKAHKENEHYITSSRQPKGWNGSSCVPLMGESSMAYKDGVVTATDRDLPDVGRDTSTTRVTFSEVPSRLSNIIWNCSVPSWPLFESHFRCNLRKECSGGEDEEECPYTFCEHGGVAFLGHCYFYFINDVGVSWIEAQQKCRNLDGNLASLPTVKTWNDINHWLHIEARWHGNPMYIGLTSTTRDMPHMYSRYVEMWTDLTMAYFSPYTKNYHEQVCGILFEPNNLFLKRYIRFRGRFLVYLCEKEHGGTNETTSKTNVKRRTIKLPEPGESTVPFPHTVCPSGHSTHEFLSCDGKSKCWGHQTGNEVQQQRTSSCLIPLPAPFWCSGGGEHVPYSMVCDHSPDCLDSSDEDFCIFPACHGSQQFQCDNKECHPARVECDQIQDCRDRSDEEYCGRFKVWKAAAATGPPPAVISFDGTGHFKSKSLVDFSQCPETHFQCPDDGYCLPVYVICNGVFDCHGHGDEEECGDYHCPNFYRCRDSTICLHVHHLCDGWAQCPQHDDERFCNLTCPDVCTCFGHSFICFRPFDPGRYARLRDLDGSDSGLDPDKLGNNLYLIRLKLARCELVNLGNTVFLNLRSLDLSVNHLQSLSANDLKKFPKLTYLNLMRNPIETLLVLERQSVSEFFALQTFHLSYVKQSYLDPRIFEIFPNLHILNLSHSNILEIHQQGFQSLKSLQTLDVSGCPLTTIPKDIFKDLTSLQHVFADNYKVCCPATLPVGFVTDNCRAKFDEISSCDNLLRSHLYRASLAVFATLATVGNSLSFGYRFFYLENRKQSGFAVFVTNLCVADFFMGIYLVIIGVADRLYLNSYLWADVQWRHSVVCKLAGFLSLLSSEVSASIVCVVTLDRFLVLRFPFSRLRFQRRSAQIVCGILFAIGIVIAMIPLLPVTAHWEFYSQTGICIPLPVTRQQFAGHNYAFGVMIIFNFILFLCIAVGQLSIYSAVRSQSMAGGVGKKSKELTVARRLFTVVVSDFMCWFPIGLLGLLASRGMPIPGEVNVSMAIFVMPLNSALNPFLYSLNTIRERRVRAREEKLLKSFRAQERK